MTLFETPADNTAEFSPDRAYRYALYRTWDNDKPKVLFVGLNPSTADESVDDPTIRRCRRFAADWGCGGLVMANLFALRAMDPGAMLAHDAPISSPEEPRQNDIWLRDLARRADLIIAAWGNNGGYLGRDQAVLSFLPTAMCLGLTKKNRPKHPLYLLASTLPQKFLKRADDE